jgi:hypothetical protein
MLIKYLILYIEFIQFGIVLNTGFYHRHEFVEQFQPHSGNEDNEKLRTKANFPNFNYTRSSGMQCIFCKYIKNISSFII